METDKIIKLLNKISIEITKSDLDNNKTNEINEMVFEIRDSLLNKDSVLSVPDIRNKLSPVTHLISMIELDEKEFIEKAIPNVKRSVNYLSQREVYKIT